MRLPALTALAGALLGLLAPGAAAQSAGDVFSFRRVGGTVEAEERAYFRLFPSLPETGPLTLMWTGPDSLDVVQGGRPTGLRVSADQVRLLDRYVAGYEALFPDGRPDIEPVLVRGLVRWRQPFQAPSRAVVERRDGAPVEGEILYADASGLVVSTGERRFGFLDAPADLVAVSADDVLRVSTGSPVSRFDLRTGGDPERYVRAALPRLRPLAAFYGPLPPELRTFVDAAARQAASRPGSRPDAAFLRRPLTRFELSFSTGGGRLDAGTTTTHLFGGATVEDEWRTLTASVEVRAEVHLTRRLGVGATVRTLGSGPMTGGALNRLDYGGVGAGLHVRLALLPPQLQRIALPTVSLRAGPTLTRVTTTSRLDSQFTEAFNEASASFSSTAFRPGLSGGIDASVRVSRALSVDVGVGAAVVSGLREDERVLPDPRPVVGRQKTVDPRTATLRTAGASVGLSVHF